MGQVIDVNELINDLNKETEGDQRQDQQQPKPKEETIETPKPKADDFEPEQKKETDAASHFTTDEAKATAATWLKWFNSLLKISFPYFYKKTVLRPGDEERMAAFVRANAGKSEREMETIISSDDNLWPVKNRFDRYLKACDAMELSQPEVDMIAEPLAKLIVKYRYLQLGPEWSLVIAVLIVMLPRFEPMMPSLGKIFESVNDKAK